MFLCMLWSWRPPSSTSTYTLLPYTTLFRYPTTLLLDRKGRELGRLVGPAEWDSLEVLAFIRRLVERTTGWVSDRRPLERPRRHLGLTPRFQEPPRPVPQASRCWKAPSQPKRARKNLG